MEKIIDNGSIQTIRPQLARCREACASLASELKNPRLTFIERTVISAEWRQMRKEGDILAHVLGPLREWKRGGHRMN